MKVAILGTGCPKCEKLAENATMAAREQGGDITVEKITDINDIIAHGVMLTPALAIDGRVVSTGKVLGVEEIKTLLSK